MANLEEALGKKLYSQVQEKLKDTDIEIADIGSGDFVLKSEFDAVQKTADDYKAQVDERDKQIEELGKQDGNSEELNKKIKDLEQKNKDDADKYQTELKKISEDTAIEKAFEGTRVKNMKSVMSHVDREKVKVVDGKVFGLTEQLDAIEKEHDYLFNPVDADTGGGTNPNGEGYKADDDLSDEEYMAKKMEEYNK